MTNVKPITKESVETVSEEPREQPCANYQIMS